LAEQSNAWTAIANMLSRRSSAGVAVLEGMLYVAGGNDGTSCLNSVERFNPKTNTWEGVAPMNIRRSVPLAPPSAQVRIRIFSALLPLSFYKQGTCFCEIGAEH